MMVCNHCEKKIWQGEHYIELGITAYMMGRPMPFFFIYCSTACQLKDMKIAVKQRPMEDDGYAKE